LIAAAVAGVWLVGWGCRAVGSVLRGRFAADGGDAEE
jgi:hypothetical protein